MSEPHESREDLYIRALETVLRSGALVNSTLNIESVLDHAMQWAEEFMEASASSIYELDEATDELFVRLARGEKKDSASEIRLRVGEGIAGNVVQSGEPVIVQDVDQDSRFDSKFDRLTGFNTQSMICVPLIVRGRPIGAIQVINKKSGEEFTRTDLDLLTAASQQIAVAMENAKLYERLQHKFQLTEQELKRTQERLLRSERLSAVGNLVQGVAHEIRNPLMTIGGFARRIKVKETEDKSLSRYADIILEEAGRLEKLVQDVREFSEVQTAKLSPSRIEAVIEEIVPKIEALAQETGVQVRLSMDDDIPLLDMDCSQMAKALVNIAENGIEAMPSGGNLEIQVLKGKRNLSLCISDTGKGIAEDQLNSIYDPFVTSKTRGAGLGLTMVHRIITNHRGEIEIQTAEGKGTTFTVQIPFSLPNPVKTS